MSIYTHVWHIYYMLDLVNKEYTPQAKFRKRAKCPMDEWLSKGKKIPVLKYVKYHVPSDSQMPEKDN